MLLGEQVVEVLLLGSERPESEGYPVEHHAAIGAAKFKTRLGQAVDVPLECDLVRGVDLSGDAVWLNGEAQG